MAEVRLRVNENGRVALPVAFRRALDIRPGDHRCWRAWKGTRFGLPRCGIASSGPSGMCGSL